MQIKAYFSPLFIGNSGQILSNLVQREMTYGVWGDLFSPLTLDFSHIMLFLLKDAINLGFKTHIIDYIFRKYK